MTAIPSLAVPSVRPRTPAWVTPGEFVAHIASRLQSQAFGELLPRHILLDDGEWEQEAVAVAASDNLASLLGSMAASGWVRGLHPLNALQVTWEADSEAVSELCCPKCHRQQGLVYHPFRREDNTPGYRAAASCPDCFFCEQF